MKSGRARRIGVAMAWSLVQGVIAQQDSVAMRYAATITQADLKDRLGVLASDAYEGRETGMKGQKMAAAYIREQFISYGIPPVPQAEAQGLEQGYLQPYPVELTTPGGVSMVVAGESKGFMQDYFYFAQKMEGELRDSTIVFAGTGVGPLYNDFLKGNVQGKVVLVVQEESGAVRKTDRPATGFFQMLTERSQAAEAAGARVLLVASPQAHGMMAEYARYITAPRMKLGGGQDERRASGLQTIIIDQAMAEAILSRSHMTLRQALRKAHKKAGLEIKCPVFVRAVPDVQHLEGENVLGYVEGSDKKDELVVVTAHYDHIGMEAGEVYNGADDDGSGTVAVLEMAQAFAQAKAEGHGPRRSMLFMPVSGEEKGLLGSDWYSQHPVFPLNNTVADLNIDMIGRVDSAHEGKEPYVYIIGSDRLSSDLHGINEHANGTYTRLDLDYTFDDDKDPNRFYYRSDHYNFAKHGVPIIFYFNGVHADYHQPGDEVEKIRFDLLQERARLVFYTAWELADREERIRVDKPMPRE